MPSQWRYRKTAQRPFREYCTCGAPRTTSQDNGVTTVTKFRPMTIKHPTLQRVNLALQPCYNSILSSSRTLFRSASRERFSGFREIRCYPAGVNSPRDPTRRAPSQGTAHSLRKFANGKITSGSDQSCAHAKPFRERGDDGRNRWCGLEQASTYIYPPQLATFSELSHNPLVYFIHAYSIRSTTSDRTSAADLHRLGTNRTCGYSLWDMKSVVDGFMQEKNDFLLSKNLAKYNLLGHQNNHVGGSSWSLECHNFLQHCSSCLNVQ